MWAHLTPTETSLHDGIRGDEICPPYYTLFRRNRLSHKIGGGVILNVNPTAALSAWCSRPSLPLHFMKILLGVSYSLTLRLVYRSPNTSSIDCNKPSICRRSGYLMAWWRGHSRHCLPDFARAFDLENHILILTQLNCYGIAPSVIKWIESCLRRHSFQVSVNGSLS